MHAVCGVLHQSMTLSYRYSDTKMMHATRAVILELDIMLLLLETKQPWGPIIRLLTGSSVQEYAW